MNASLAAPSNTIDRLDVLDDKLHGGPMRLSVVVGRHPLTPQIDALRVACYRHAGYFKLPDESTVLTRTDPSLSLCFAVHNRDMLAATVRVALALDAKRAEAILEGPVPRVPNLYPAMTLCRGATDTRFRGQGLMPFLMALGVEAAARTGLGGVLVMQAEGTPHFGALLKAGWQSRDVQTELMKTVDVVKSYMKFVYLSRDMIRPSIDYSRAKYAVLAKGLHAGDAVSEAAQTFMKFLSSTRP